MNLLIAMVPCRFAYKCHITNITLEIFPPYIKPSLEMDGTLHLNSFFENKYLWSGLNQEPNVNTVEKEFPSLIEINRHVRTIL